MLDRITSATHGATPQEILGDLKDLVEVLRRGWRMIALCVLICLSLAIIYLAGAKRVYRATARLLVLQQGGRPLNMANNDPTRLMESNDDYIPTHALILSSPLVIQRAIDKVGLHNLPTLQEVKRRGDDPVKRAIELLKVTRPDRLARVLRVDFEAGSREEATRMLEAITASYKGYLETTFQKNSTQVVELITRARDDLSKELRDLDAKYIEFRRKSSVLATNETGRSFIAQRLEQSDRALNDAREKALNLRMQLELGRKLAAQGSALWAIAHAISQLGGDSNSLIANLSTSTSQFGATDYVRQLIQDQQQLAERYGLENVRVKELQEQITRIQERSRSSRSDLERVETDDLLGSIEQSLKSVEAVGVELASRFDEAREQAREVEIDLIAEANLRAEVERQRALFNTVVDQLKQAQFAGDFNSINSEIIEPANALPRPVSPRTSVVLALGVLMGGMIGVGAALVAHWMDQRIRSHAELRQVLDYSVLGLITQLPDDQSVEIEEFGLISSRMPRSAWAEAYRSIRTNLEFLRRSRDIQVIQVTSPFSNDGKSASASNLAISLANAGRKVLLIDADLRKPSLHKIFGLTKVRGLSLVLKDQLSVAQVIQQSTVEGLDLIAAGPEPSNPAELLASPRFAAVLAEVRERYDTVIIDTSPILAVTDPAIIGASVDGVILVVQTLTLKRRDAEMSREVLRTLGTPVLGTVINRAGPDEVGGSHGYGYGYGYGYGSFVDPAAEAARMTAIPTPEAEPVGVDVNGLTDPFTRGLPGHSANGHAITAASPESNS